MQSTPKKSPKKASLVKKTLKRAEEACYAITKNYTSLTIWWFDPVTRQRRSITRHKMDAGMTRLMRFGEIASLMRNAGLQPPPFRSCLT